MSLTPYWADDRVTLYLGDCIEVLAGMESASVDAIVTDPPYNLSDSGKRDRDCLRRILAQVHLPHLENGDAEHGQGVQLARPPLGSTALSREHGAVRVDARVGVPEGAVDLKHAPVAEQEVSAGDVAAERATDESLPLIADAQAVEHLGDYILKLADGRDESFCDSTCSCFTEPSAGVIAVTVALPGAAGSDALCDLLGTLGSGDKDVRALNNAGSQAEGAAPVLADRGAETRAVLSLDLARRTGHLRIADGASDNRPLLTIESAQEVGAGAGARRLAAVTESDDIGLIKVSASRAFTLHFPWHALKSNGQAGGFMGKTWDGWKSPASFQRWCTAWARECLRVLKPGGYMLAAGSSRTFHRLVCAVEDAGFEIRDTIMHHYGSGFPKNRNVSNDLRKIPPCACDIPGQIRTVDASDPAAKLMAADGADGADVNAIPGALSRNDQPTAERLTRCEACGGRRGEVPEGLGTALKAATEFWTVARKPLAGTVAQNFMEHGSGALNIDACRVATSDSLGGGAVTKGSASHTDGWDRPWKNDPEATAAHAARVAANVEHAQLTGRWPPNLLLTHSAACEVVGFQQIRGDARSGQERGERQGGFADVGADRGSNRPNGHLYGTQSIEVFDCAPDCPAAELDRQSGVLTSGANPSRRGSDKFRDAYGEFAGQRECEPARGADSGGASRFFPVFRYEAKAGSSERPRGEDGTAHPTVKPVDLMAWLVRLVTPPAGIVLDPFAGSGTTAEACIVEGFRCVLVEKDPAYAELIRTRLRKPIQPAMFGGEVA